MRKFIITVNSFRELNHGRELLHRNIIFPTCIIHTANVYVFIGNFATKISGTIVNFIRMQIKRGSRVDSTKWIRKGLHVYVENIKKKKNEEIIR